MLHRSISRLRGKDNFLQITFYMAQRPHHAMIAVRTGIHTVIRKCDCVGFSCFIHVTRRGRVATPKHYQTMCRFGMCTKQQPNMGNVCYCETQVIFSLLFATPSLVEHTADVTVLLKTVSLKVTISATCLAARIALSMRKACV